MRKHCLCEWRARLGSSLGSSLGGSDWPRLARDKSIGRTRREHSRGLINRQREPRNVRTDRNKSGRPVGLCAQESTEMDKENRIHLTLFDCVFLHSHCALLVVGFLQANWQTFHRSQSQLSLYRANLTAFWVSLALFWPLDLLLSPPKRATKREVQSISRWIGEKRIPTARPSDSRCQSCSLPRQNSLPRWPPGSLEVASKPQVRRPMKTSIPVRGLSGASASEWDRLLVVCHRGCFLRSSVPIDPPSMPSSHPSGSVLSLEAPVEAPKQRLMTIHLDLGANWNWPKMDFDVSIHLLEGDLEA